MNVREFGLNEKENEMFIEWRNKIKEIYNDGDSGSFTFSFTPTGIGNKIVVKSHRTGSELDITDYDSW